MASEGSNVNADASTKVETALKAICLVTEEIAR